MENRSCENCGNTQCKNSVFAIYYDRCIEEKYTKYWKPMEKNDGKADNNIDRK